MDQNGLNPFGQRLKPCMNGLLPGGAPGNGRQHFRQTGSALIIERLVVGMDDGKDQIDAGMTAKGKQGPAQHGHSRDRTVLLGQAASGP